MTIRSDFIAVSLAVCALAVPAWAGGGFVDGFDELPLMPGLFSVTEENLSFDKPSGRIVQAEARGALAPEDVRKFYRETVPQLGWRKAGGEDRFVRDGEALHLEIAPAPPDAGGRRQITVRFLLSPE